MKSLSIRILRPKRAGLVGERPRKPHLAAGHPAKTGSRERSPHHFSRRSFAPDGVHLPWGALICRVRHPSALYGTHIPWTAPICRVRHSYPVRGHSFAVYGTHLPWAAIDCRGRRLRSIRRFGGGLNPAGGGKSAFSSGFKMLWQRILGRRRGLAKWAFIWST